MSQDMLGGPMPEVGAQFCRGWKERAKGQVGAFEIGTVLCAVEIHKQGLLRWAAIVRVPNNRGIELMDNIGVHSKLWRTMDRADERISS